MRTNNLASLIIRGTWFFGIVLLAGCGADPVSGVYHVDQKGEFFGPQAEVIELDLKSDRTYTVRAGPNLKMMEGTWKVDGKTLTLSAEYGRMGSTYRIQDAKTLVPVFNGKDVTEWKWSR